jgi:hypothetical protein
MAREIKRQQLLSRDLNPKKTKPTSKKKPQPQQLRQAKESQKNQRTKIAKKKSGLAKKLLMGFVGIILVAMIIVPKPHVLVYKKLNLVAQSIYIPGWFGQPGHFLDSPQRVIVDKQLALVYLCFSKTQPKEQCNRYQFIEQKGLIDTFNYYLKHNNYQF